MTDTNETKTATSRTPSHYAYNVRNREGGENYWIRIGSAWTHADGNGFNIQLETVPLDGRITQFEDRVVNRLDSVSHEIDSRGREVVDALHWKE